jgi:Restriction endonuclease XhoI
MDTVYDDSIPKPLFVRRSYKKRYEILCRRLILERLYDAACFVTAAADPASAINEPAPDLSFTTFASAIRARATGLLSAE